MDWCVAIQFFIDFGDFVASVYFVAGGNGVAKGNFVAGCNGVAKGNFVAFEACFQLPVLPIQTETDGTGSAGIKHCDGIDFHCTAVLPCYCIT